ncbi:MAG: phosphate ABC transporter permease PstA [Bacteroidaceae bacterium]|nr:phosphate ABC transporter permease PstA [Bacteroidaceae bacterium]
MKKLSVKHIEEKVMKILMVFCSLLVLAFVVSIVWTIVVKGIKSFSWEMITQVPGKDWNTADDGGFLNAILGSLLVVVPAMLLATAISIPIVFYMNLYLRRSHPLSYAVRLAFDVLYGIPSIVYGAFAFTVMVLVGMRASLMGGIAVTTLLMIPMLIRSGDEISKSVPDEMVDAAYSLGATKWETLWVITRQVLPGMITAVLLAVGKAIGDAAAVMFTAGFSDAVPDSLSDPTATLPLAIFNWIIMPEPFPDRCYSAALVLTLIVLILSLSGRWLGARFTKHNV